jgi:hypothetical protein
VLLQVRCIYIGTQSLDILAAFGQKKIRVVTLARPVGGLFWWQVVKRARGSRGEQTSSPCALVVSGQGACTGWYVGCGATWPAGCWVVRRTRAGRRPHHGGLSVRCGKWAPGSDFLPWLRKKNDVGESGHGARELIGSCC